MAQSTPREALDDPEETADMMCLYRRWRWALLVVLVLDCQDPIALAPFWAQALGYRQSDFEEPYLALTPTEPGRPELLLQRVPEPKAGKNRMHLDLRVDRLEEERDRLLALGATRVSGEISEDGFRWYVMADPEGNEFCVIQEPKR